MKRILITGGTGLIGRRLIDKLLERNYEIHCLTRDIRNDNALPAKVKCYNWDVNQGIWDTRALYGVNAIIHLAGEGIANKRWSSARKNQLILSRTETINLLIENLSKIPNQVKAIVSASAIGYYGINTADVQLSESSPCGTDFPAYLVKEWENAVDEANKIGVRTVKLRTGIVLSTKGGALLKFIQPTRWGLGSPLGSGTQIQSWIHIDDLCDLYIAAIENTDWQGPYNAVSPSPVTNEFLVKALSKAMNKPSFMPKVPAFFLKLLFGEMAQIILSDNYVVNTRVRDETNFRYSFPDLNDALIDLINYKK